MGLTGVAAAEPGRSRRFAERRVRPIAMGRRPRVLINRATGRCLDSGTNGNPQAQAVLQRWDCVRWATDWIAANSAVTVRQPGFPPIQ